MKTPNQIHVRTLAEMKALPESLSVRVNFLLEVDKAPRLVSRAVSIFSLVFIAHTISPNIAAMFTHPTGSPAQQLTVVFALIWLWMLVQVLKDLPWVVRLIAAKRHARIDLKRAGIAPDWTALRAELSRSRAGDNDGCVVG